MNRFIVALALTGAFVGSASAQDIVGRKETTFNISERVASGDSACRCRPTASPESLS